MTDSPAETPGVPARRPPFGLIAGALFVLAIVLGGGWYLRTATANAAEEAARAELEKHGIILVKTDGHVQVLNSMQPIDDVVFARIAELGHLTTCNLSGAKVTDAQLAMLQQLPQLMILQVDGSPTVTSAGMEHVAGLRALEKLFANGTSVDDSGLSHLGNMSQLTTLDVSDTKISDAGLKYLSSAPKLEVLRLRNDNVTNAAIDSFKAMAALKVLDISGTKITDEGLKSLRAAKSDIVIEQQEAGR